MKTLKLFLLVSAALLPAIAHAQDGNEIVVVASGVEQSADEVGRAVTLIERDEIETRQTVSIAELLATKPGVTVTRNGGPGGLTAVRIRGAEDAQTLVLIDGVRVNDPSSPSAAFDFGNLLASAVERVEVLRGPNSVVWGSQAIGGVVNVVTTRGTQGLGLRANAEYGYADQLSGSAALAYGNDTVQAGLTGGYFRTDGISQAAAGSEADGYRQANGSGRLRVEFAPGFGVDLRGYYAHSRLELDGFPPPSYVFADTAEFSEAQEAYGHAGLYGDIGPVKSRLSFTIADINRDNYDPAAGSAPLYLYRGRSERYAYQGEARAADALRLVFGAEQENTRFHDGTDTFRADITSIYGEAIVTPVEALTVTAGVRNDDHSRFGSHVSWGVNAALQAGAGTILRASFGEGFKAPTLYQLFAPFYGTETLVPESAESWEVGAEQRLIGGAATVRATYFHRDTRNQIDFDLTSFTYDNIARARAQGIELELELRPVDALAFTANYTLTDTENRSVGFEGNELARRPRDTASVSADWRTPVGLSLGGTVSIVGDSFNDAGNATRLDGYALASIRAELPIGERFALYGRVENVTDARYRTVAGYGTYGRAAYGGIRMRLN
jgi:vitamin B12 transporter